MDAERIHHRPIIPFSKLRKVTGYGSPTSHPPEATETPDLLRVEYYVLKSESLIKDTTFRCAICAQVNPKEGRKIYKGARLEEMDLGHWELDLTELRPIAFSYKHLLVFPDNPSGQMETHLT